MADSAGQIVLRTDKQTYRPGDPVSLTIVNGSDHRYSFNPCQRLIERESASAWTEVREERMCTMIAHIIDAKATRTEQTELGAELQRGRYRLVVLFSDDDPAAAGRSVRAVSAPITVD